MNKKGFIFAETLIAIVIILVLIVLFYAFSTVFINRQNQYKSYDNLEEIYKLANIRLYLYRTSSNFNNLIETADEDGCVPLNNILYEDNTALTNEYKEIIDAMEINQLYLCSFENLNAYSFNDDFEFYYDYIQNNYNDKYRIIGHFKNDKFASIKAWSVTS